MRYISLDQSSRPPNTEIPRAIPLAYAAYVSKEVYKVRKERPLVEKISSILFSFD